MVGIGSYMIGSQISSVLQSTGAFEVIVNDMPVSLIIAVIYIYL